MSLRTSIQRQRMSAKGGIPQWMKDANEEYGIPIANLQDAYAIDKNIEFSFYGDRSRGLLFREANNSIDTGLLINGLYEIETRFRLDKTNRGWMFVYGSSYSTSTTSNLCINGSNTQTTAKSFGLQLYQTFDRFDANTYYVRSDNNDFYYHNETNRVQQTLAFRGGQGIADGNTFLGKNPLYGWGSFYGKMHFFRITNQGVTKFFIPFNNNGEATMIDLMADDCVHNLPSKVGNFTIED